MGYQHTKDVCPFIAYCMSELRPSVFRGIIFWRFLSLPPIAPNKRTAQI